MKYSKSNILAILFAAFLTVVSAQENYLDTNFGNGGITLSDLFVPVSLSLQEDGKILVAGSSGNSHMVLRFNTDGSPDSEFGTNGKATILGINSLVDLIVLPNGQLLALGHAQFSANPYPGYYQRLAFIRLNSGGTPDNSVGIMGRRVVNVGSSTYPSRMKLHGDKIFVIGTEDGLPIIAKFNLDVSLDTSFSFGDGYEVWYGDPGNFIRMDIFDNDNIAVVFEDGNYHALYNFNAAGEPIVVVPIELGSASDEINGIKILPGGKMLINGSRAGNSRDGVLLKLNDNGYADTTFGTSGLFVLDNNFGQDEAAIESVALGNGKIITGAKLWSIGFDLGFSVTNSNGTPDAGTGQDGRIISDLEGSQKTTCMAQQQDGKILVAGFDENNMVLMRFDISEVLSKPLFETGEILVYPNPASDKITLTSLPDETAIALYTASGQKLLESVIHGTTQLDISSLTQGVYLLRSAVGYAKIVKK